MPIGWCRATAQEQQRLPGYRHTSPAVHNTQDELTGVNLKKLQHPRKNMAGMGKPVSKPLLCCEQVAESAINLQGGVGLDIEEVAPGQVVLCAKSTTHVCHQAWELLRVLINRLGTGIVRVRN